MASVGDCVESIPWGDGLLPSGDSRFLVLGSDPNGSRLCVWLVFPHVGTLIWCGNSTSRMDIELFDHLSGRMDCFDQLCDEGEGDISSICDSTGVFPQNWLQPRLSNTGLLKVTGVRFGVFEIGLFRAADSVRFGSEPVVSDVTEDGDEIPMTTGYALAGRWLQVLCVAEVCVARGGAYGSSNQSALTHRRVLPEWGDGVYLDCVHSAGISWSPAHDRVTAPFSSSLSPGCVV